MSIKGKEYIKYDGLVQLASDRGWNDCQTEAIQLPSSTNDFYAAARAVVKTETGTYSGLGDASKDSVEPRMYPHLLRMAETRAKARALRDALRIGMVAVEELSSLEDAIGDESSETPRPTAPSTRTREIDKDPSEIVVKFGKYNGKTLGEIKRTEPGYIAWLAENANVKIVKDAAMALK